jgi:hypothetical protein
MSTPEENRFQQELGDMEERLRQLGGSTRKQGMLDADSGLNATLDLPYSKLPKLYGRRWSRTEKILDARAPEPKKRGP